MKIHTSVDSYENGTHSVVTIGTFDGVHIGHKAILEKLNETARKEKLDSVVLTFFPHPRMVLQKDSDIKMINTITEKKELFAKTGLDHIVVQPFTPEFSRMTALEYVRDILVNGLGAKKVIIGYDHRFGRNRTATVNDLIEYGETYGFTVEEISAQEMDNVTVSSTKIRRALEEGDITTANRYLGYPFMLSGVVVPGNRLGRTINYPTANLEIREKYKLIPAAGVYIVFSEVDGKVVYGITSIGTNPTVGGTRKTIETFFLDYSGDLYERELRIEFIHRIREEKTFENVTALKQAIAEDETFAREYLKNFG